MPSTYKVVSVVPVLTSSRSNSGKVLTTTTNDFLIRLLTS
jgi:hypothetical protein